MQLFTFTGINLQAFFAISGDLGTIQSINQIAIAIFDRLQKWRPVTISSASHELKIVKQFRTVHLAAEFFPPRLLFAFVVHLILGGLTLFRILP